MSKLERVLIPGSNELPDCICGQEMALLAVENSFNGSGTELRTYLCEACGHRLRLTVWSEQSPLETEFGL